jgi:quercetin dioxygenase-like cupin family protein/nucleoside-diphosphate-sugar epimerase
VLHLAIARGNVAFTEALEIDRRALVALGSALEGTDRPLVFASATSMIEPGRVITEQDAGDTTAPGSRGRAEDEVLELAGLGVRVAVVRLATLVHGDQDRQGFLPMLIETARARGVSAYVDDGRNRWPGVHRLDAARLLRLAIEGAPAGVRLHAVAEEGIAFRELAHAIGNGLGLPTISISAEQVADHFSLLPGPLAALTGTDIPASSATTRQLLNWRPVGPDVLADLTSGTYLRRRTHGESHVPLETDAVRSPATTPSTEQGTTMQLHRIGSGPTTVAPEENFTGRVGISGYFQRETPSRLTGAAATFPPGARTPWKVNPGGQTVIVTSGVGWAQSEGEEIVELHAGDMAWFPPGTKHWEGATPTDEMTYIALHETTVEFGEKVTDDEYYKRPADR